MRNKLGQFIKGHLLIRNAGFQKGHKGFRTRKSYIKAGEKMEGEKNCRYGKSPWNKGKHLTETHKRKIGIAQEGEKGHSWKDGRSKNQRYKSEYTKKWKIENRDKVAFYTRKRRARKMCADGSHTFGEWELLKKQYGYTCPACGRKRGQKSVRRKTI